MIDFKKAEGHYKPSSDVLNYFKEISSKDINNLSSHDPLYLKEAIAKVLDVNINRICIGNGSSEILVLLPHIKGYSKEHLVVTPTYDPFFKAIELSKGVVHNVSLNEVDDFEWTRDTTDQVLSLVKKKSNINTIWLCSPNNPCGTIIPILAIEKILKNFKGMVIVDEAFIEYIDDYKKNSSVLLTKVYSNLVVLRTFSKIYGNMDI